MYENEPEFPGGKGSAKKKPSMGGVWIFSGTAQSSFLESAVECTVNQK